MRKGANTLAVELHAAPADGKGADWSTAGLCDVKLTSQTGIGVASYPQAIKGPTLWNATALDTVANVPGKRQTSPYSVANTPVGLTRGNPFEALRPIRAIAPRGGTCSGQIVVSGPGPLGGLKVTLGSLRQTRGNAVLPAESVRVCYAIQEKDDVFCSALQPQPATGATVQPMWVVVDVPRNQSPGWYTGTLTVTLSAETRTVPVQVLVAGWTLTDPKDNATFVSLYQSPDTLAQYYRVEPWSERHFALIEKSMQSMAGMGNDVLLVPVILDNYLHHSTGLVRWVRKGTGFEPEFSALEKYLDLHTKIFGKPKVVTLSIWKHDFGTRRWFRGMLSDVVKPCFVTELDSRTGAMKPMQAPHFGEPGSEEFWKTMIEGVRRIAKARGCDDRFLLLGEPFDSRPLVPVLDFFKRIEPTMRWQIYSHFDGGEPPPKDGKWIVHGGFELGFCIGPNGGGAAVPEFNRNYPKVSTSEYISAGAQRFGIAYTSSPLSYRVVLQNGGAIARIGLDFWPVFDIRGRTYYSCPPGEAWLWRCHVPALTAAGPDGAVRTTRGQMLLEGVQEAEVFVVLMRAKQKATLELAARIEQCFAQRRNADVVGGILSQAMISLDFGAMVAREYAIAGELAGTTSEDDWSKPPAP